MRVTDSILHNNAVNHLSRNLEAYVEAQRRVATGKRVSVFSDDPVAASASLRAKVRMAELEQYGRNIDDANLWMSFTDNALDQATQLIREARDLAVAGANGTESQEQREARASQVDLIISQLIRIGNSTYNGRYIFAGQDTSNAPFASDADPLTEVTYSDRLGADNNILYEVGPGDYQSINLRGDQAFGDGEAIPSLVFDTLIALRDNLMMSQPEEISNERIAELDTHLDRIGRYRAEIGTKINAFDNIKLNLQRTQIDLANVRSEAEDVDMVEAITELSQRENIYQAAMLATARISSLSLANYL